MVGHKLGEFSPTRLFRGHTGAAKAEDKKAAASRQRQGHQAATAASTPAKGQAAVK